MPMPFFWVGGGGGGGHFAEMQTVADGRGVGVKYCENLPTS